LVHPVFRDSSAIFKMRRWTFCFNSSNVC